MNPKSTDCEADALTTTPSQLDRVRKKKGCCGMPCINGRDGRLIVMPEEGMSGRGTINTILMRQTMEEYEMMGRNL